MNSAVAFGCVVLFMLAATAVAVFTGFVEPISESAMAKQETQLKNLVVAVFVVGAVIVVWHTSRREVQ